MESVEACKIRDDIMIASMCADGSAWENTEIVKRLTSRLARSSGAEVP